MYGPRIVTGLAVVLAAIAALFLVLGVASNPVFLAVAVIFGAAAYFIWYHASGRMAARLYRGVESQAEVDAGPGTRVPGGRSRSARGEDGGAGSGESGGFGAGPRDGRDSRRGPRQAGTRATDGRSGARGRRARAGGRRSRTAREAGDGNRPPGDADPGVLTASEAYSTLDLDRGADASDVKAAYREKVKEVHPDRPSGDEEAFKRVNAAYERLRDD